ncbi:transporter substrate-binding domain-containing protein [Paracoccaceae bacterium]|jgi:mxaJ protein|nr:transporter substrate-binding domain-containing protein [Paracoccaceae bacterium]
MKYLTIITTFLICLTNSLGAYEFNACANPEGLPYSNSQSEGFENKILREIASELDAKINWIWITRYNLKKAKNLLDLGECDVITGVIDGQKGLLTTHALYRSNYVFVANSANNLPDSLDDNGLKSLRIGVIGGANRLPPPAVALARRGLLQNISFFQYTPKTGEAERRLIRALESGQIDLAIQWGPTLSLFKDNEFLSSNITPEIDIPFLPMFASISFGVRMHDEALRDDLDHAIAKRWDELQTILLSSSIPLTDLPRPRIMEGMK